MHTCTNMQNNMHTHVSFFLFLISFTTQGGF